MFTAGAPCEGELFDTQQLLFDRTRPVAEEPQMPESYYECGWAAIDDIPDHYQALDLMARLISNIDGSRLPLHGRFHERIQLAKADQIPVCDDVQASNYQVLHFDMGHPFAEDADPLFVSHAGIYRSPRPRDIEAFNNLAASNGTPPISEPYAETRIVGIEGLSSLPPSAISERLADYASTHGDGWGEHNSGRIAAGVRLLDALSDAPSLQAERDKTVGQWFNDGTKVHEAAAFEKEAAFFAEHDIDLEAVEECVFVEPGQLLIMDNVRTMHGRSGHREVREVFNFMFGVEAIDTDDIQALRQYIGNLLAGG